MDRSWLSQVCEQVYRRFPEVRGCQPKVQAYAQAQHLLVFQTKGAASDGRSIPHIVRVVVNKDGKIIKATSSR